MRLVNLAASVLSILPSSSSPFHRIPESDRAILHVVSHEYKLTRQERRLLFAIRIAENGGSGREMGVLTEQAQRYKGDHEKSLRLQGQWAAGTIKKRYHGDLKAFADRWCPPHAHELNRHWLKNVKSILGE
jgi:hypothetical protein